MDKAGPYYHNADSRRMVSDLHKVAPEVFHARGPGGKGAADFKALSLIHI